MLETKILSFGRVGTIAVNNALAMHPALEVPGWEDSDQMLRNHELVFHEEKKTCLTLHAQRLFADKFKKDQEYAVSLPANKLIHLVRDPMTLVVGWYNHILSSAMLGISGWEHPGSFDEFLSGRHHIFPTLHNEMIAQLFYPDVEQRMLVDFSELSKDKFSDTINRLFSFLDVENREVHFDGTQNDLTLGFLVKGFTINIAGEQISFTMNPANLASDIFIRDSFMAIYDLGETMRQYCPSLRPVEGPVYIGFKEGTMLRESTGALLRQHKAEVIPQILQGWAQNAERMTKEINEKRISALNSAGQDKLWQVIGEDVRAFVKRYPQLRDSWSRY